MRVPSSELDCVQRHSVCLLDELAVEDLFDRLAADITRECENQNPDRKSVV